MSTSARLRRWLVRLWALRPVCQGEQVRLLGACALAYLGQRCRPENRYENLASEAWLSEVGCVPAL